MEVTEKDVEIYEKSGLKTRIEPPIWKTHSKDEFMDVLSQCNGLVLDTAKFLGTTPKRVWNAIRKWNLETYKEDCRKGLVSRGESVLNNLLTSENERIQLEAAKFILERLGREDGWGKDPDVAQQINIQGDADIKSIFGIDNSDKK